MFFKQNESVTKHQFLEAVSQGNVATVRLYLQQNSNDYDAVNCKDTNGQTALEIATIAAVRAAKENTFSQSHIDVITAIFREPYALLDLDNQSILNAIDHAKHNNQLGLLSLLINENEDRNFNKESFEKFLKMKG